MIHTSRTLSPGWFAAAGAAALLGLSVPPAAAHAAAPLSCGQTLTADAVLTADLLDCPGDGLVIGRGGITVDLNGHTVDGVGLGVGIRNDGFDNTTVTNSGATAARVEQFDHGVRLGPGASGNAVEKLTVHDNELAGVELAGADGDNRVRGNLVDRQAQRGIVLTGGAGGNVITDNTITANQGEGIFVEDSDNNRLEGNHIADTGDGGLVLEAASRNTLLGNTVGNSSDGAFVLRLGSNANLVQDNTSSLNQDAGMTVSDSSGNRILSNRFRDNGDSGIFLQASDSNTITGNDVSGNTGGIELNHADRNLIQSNTADRTTGDGIALEDSLHNTVRLNRAGHNGSRGISVDGEAAAGTGNRLIRNTAEANLGDGIHVAKAVHTLQDNIARDNDGWGILAGPGNTDGGGNRASGNAEPGQCAGVVCVP
ncbi:right-handed parallel beta-helix repeat-containing protein [Streptomyces clavuligerus]|uniref:Copper-binding protein n=1 Tax=Streptomyces clavuligerus TaxID=1901 RepID=B5GYE2_STRCL|nr:right-handed parallel beta-helix repeat-containing protein [Streptomyces clavuligerus]ANW16995.1 copper-binding protein [Streptomyces clavuligerus]AXU11525.1 copper-binding protein [Streptomyces clavuligerus]EDY51338.1 cell surface protein [Streptomyces clavuligerus]EFG10477.1 Copper-binding protein [Streptomyces clavuligerus]MBY6301345.1 right-handed parallel beta-helix repeat-containing protein [Streptomyces clavuligerus]